MPRGPAKQPSFAIGAWTVGTSAKIGLTGSLRFTSGRRKVSVSGLQVTIGRTSSFVTGRLGKSSLRLFAVTPTRPSVIDPPGRHAAIVGARFALTPAAARRLRSALKLKRTPSTGALGKLTVAVADLTPRLPSTPAPQPAPAPSATPTPAPTADAHAGPEPPCEQRFAATPAGSVDWFGCDLPGGGDLKSWTNYVQMQFPPFPCQGPLGTITASGGAARIVAAGAYDHRFGIAASEVRPDGSATIRVQGTVTYAMPVHGIDESIGGSGSSSPPAGRPGRSTPAGRPSRA